MFHQINLMKKLTQAEEEIMQILWDLKEGFVKDIIDRMPDPKPAYSTVSTVIRVLEKKGFIGHKAYGNTYLYHPLVEEGNYKSFYLNEVIDSYFGGSFSRLASFFMKDKKLSTKDLDDIMKDVKNNLKD